MGIPEDYHKKRNVFRIVMPSGTEILFQADSDESVRKWLDLIRSKTGVENTVSKTLLLIGGGVCGILHYGYEPNCISLCT